MVNTGGVTPFNLTLWNFGTGAMVVSTNYSYDDLNNVDMLTDLAVMFFLVPPPPGAPLEPIDQAWKAKQFYVEGKLAGASRLYFGHSEDSKGYDANLAYLGFTFITSAEADWQFAYFAKPEIGLAVCSGLSFTFDRPGYIDNADSPHADVWFPYASLEFPLLFRVNWKPSYFSLAAYVGAFAFVPFGEASLAGVPLGITIGVEAGRIVGPGVLSLYLRYSQDLGETKVFYDKPNDPTDIYFKRYSLAFGATYRLGFFKRPQKTAIEYTGGW
jgi:hypothetical protein